MSVCQQRRNQRGWCNDMYNPWYNVLVKEGTGTLQYQGKWNLFDQIIMTPNLLNKDGKKDFSELKFWKNQIFRRDYLFQESGKYKGNTKRTTAGGCVARWLFRPLTSCNLLLLNSSKDY